MNGLAEKLHWDLGKLTVELAWLKGGCAGRTMVDDTRVTRTGGGVLGCGELPAKWAWQRSERKSRGRGDLNKRGCACNVVIPGHGARHELRRWLARVEQPMACRSVTPTIDLWCSRHFQIPIGHESRRIWK